MANKVNLIEILMYKTNNKPLYCAISGDDCFVTFRKHQYPILVNDKNGDEVGVTTSDGRWFDYYPKGECMVFPSAENRNWNDWARSLCEEGDFLVSTNGEVFQWHGEESNINSEATARFASPQEISAYLNKLKEAAQDKEIMPAKGSLVLMRNAIAGSCWVYQLYCGMREDKFMGLGGELYSHMAPCKGNDQIVGTYDNPSVTY